MLGGRFEIEVEAGSGGMGTVYRARDLKTGLRVAVKILQRAEPDDETRFAREIEVLAGLSHSRIPAYVAHGQTPDGATFLAMEWIAGETLRRRLDETGLDAAQAVLVGRQLAEALAFAHQRGLVHRDVKPSNVIFRGGRADDLVLIDFGMARTVAGASPLTQTGALVGTPGYMAPEQVRGERTIDARANLFALGCVLYECLTGRAPFLGTHAMAIHAKVALWDPDPLHTGNPALDELVARLLAKEPGERPADAAGVAGALAAIDVSPGSVRRTEATEPATDGPRPTSDAPTAVQQRPQAIAVIVAVQDTSAVESAETLVPASADTARRTLAAAAEPLGARVHFFGDGSLVATMTGEPSAVASRAARAALSLRRALPGAHFALVVRERSRSSEEGCLDDAVRLLARQVLARVMAAEPGPLADALFVDQHTATLMGEGFSLQPGGKVWYLLDDDASR